MASDDDTTPPALARCPRTPVHRLLNETEPASDSRWAFHVFLLVASAGFTVVCVVVFTTARRHYERLRIRQRSVVWVMAVGMFVHYLGGSLVVVVQPINYPCWLRLLATTFLVPVFGSAMLARILFMWILCTLQADLLTRATTTTTAIWGMMDEERDDGVDGNVGAGGGGGSAASMKLRVLRFLKTQQGKWALFCGALFPFFILAVGLMSREPIYWNGCTNCRISGAEVIMETVAALLILGTGFYLAYLSRRFDDPWGMRREILLQCAGGLVAVLGFILSVYANPPFPETYDHQFIMTLGLCLILASATLVQVWDARSREGRMVVAVPTRVTTLVGAGASLVPLGSGKLGPSSSLAQVMHDPELGPRFREHLAGELGLEALLFLEASSEWIKNFPDLRPLARLARAQKLYRLFFAQDGQLTINVSDGHVRAVEECLAGGEDSLRVTLFDSTRTEITHLLEVGALKRFWVKRMSSSSSSS